MSQPIALWRVWQYSTARISTMFYQSASKTSLGRSFITFCNLAILLRPFGQSDFIWAITCAASKRHDTVLIRESLSLGLLQRVILHALMHENLIKFSADLETLRGEAKRSDMSGARLRPCAGSYICLVFFYGSDEI